MGSFEQIFNLIFEGLLELFGFIICQSKPLKVFTFCSEAAGVEKTSKQADQIK